MNNHSTGDWHYKPNNNVIEILSPERHIGTVWIRNSEREGKANARLIAAAPEMYRIMQAVLKDNCLSLTASILIEKILKQIEHDAE